MTKQELIDKILEKTNDVPGPKGAVVTKKQTETLLAALADVIRDSLAADEELSLPGIGKFKVAVRAARLQRNPQTGETRQAPAKKVPKFTLAKALKDAVAAE